MSKIIGIDLGTTFSAVGFVRDGKPTILPNPLNSRERIVPSVVGFSPDGKLLVGTAARNQQVLYPENTVRSIKRKMGTSDTVTLNEREYTPVEISAFILREMKRIAEANLGESVTRAVITVPAYFSDAARQATKDAGEIAGFTVERIINEPTAAALAYGLDRAGDEEMIAVYDLGGGTFDVSIIELNAGVIEVRASHGDVHLGGDDFDELLATYLANRFEEEHGVDPRQDHRAQARLLRAAEQAKIELSSQPFAQVREEFLIEQDGKPLHLEMEVSRQEFEGMIREWIERTLTAFDQSLEDAHVDAADLDRILFVGGSTRIPLVWEMVAEHTGKEPLVAINPDEAVALGAGVQAAIIAGEPLEAILVDVTPHSLGIEVAELSFMGDITGDHFAPLIHRNVTIPATYAKQFSALYPDQDTIRVKVYQGEDPVASNNSLLGEFMFDELEAVRPDEPPTITVKFDLDLNGILNVTAVDRASGNERRITVTTEHRRMNLAEKTSAAEHIALLGTAESENAGQSVLTTDLAALLFRAHQVLESQQQGAAHVRKVLNQLEERVKEGRMDGVDRLSEELLEALYDLDE